MIDESEPEMIIEDDTCVCSVFVFMLLYTFINRMGL